MREKKNWERERRRRRYFLLSKNKEIRMTMYMKYKQPKWSWKRTDCERAINIYVCVCFNWQGSNIHQRINGRHLHKCLGSLTLSPSSHALHLHRYLVSWNSRMLVSFFPILFSLGKLYDLVSNSNLLSNNFKTDMHYILSHTFFFHKHKLESLWR